MSVFARQYSINSPSACGQLLILIMGGRYGACPSAGSIGIGNVRPLGGSNRLAARYERFPIPDGRFPRPLPAAILAGVIATIVNCLAVVVGSLIGVNVHNRIGERFKEIVFTGIGLIALIVGIQMSLQMKQVLYVALSLIIGGLIGDQWDIEGAVLRLGERLRMLVTRRSIRRAAVAAGAAGKEDEASPEGSESNLGVAEGDTHEGQFAAGFLSASVLFCVGAMTLIGAFQAGAQGDYTLILTKSVMDGFMSIMLAAAMGIGVMFSVLVILVYQGGLTLLASLIGPAVNGLILSEISGVGGILVVMIGLNLLSLRKVKTANFLPALVLVVIFSLLAPYINEIGSLVSSLHPSL